jgi:cytosol alanyl aminopeptidase
MITAQENPMSIQSLVRRAGSAALLLLSAVASADDAGRLPAGVRPTFEAVTLDLDPGQAGYTGSVRVELEVEAPLSTFAFHAEEMEITSLSLSGAAGKVAARHAPAAHGQHAVTSEAPLAPGKYVLEVGFKNDYSTQGLSLYKMTARGEPYLFTQFEADEARGAFPCWDEPAYKFPYQMTLRVPAGLLAVSNTPVEKETAEGGTRTLVFARTPPMPSYLLAVAVGPMEAVDVPGTSIPTRVLTPKGASALTADAVRVTPPLLAALEKYFGRKYPYAKLDLIAVPEYWYGAMENPGAITYRDIFLLLDPKGSTTRERLNLTSITAHEIAHMWFGDLVTMKWWDDLWLNEAFASWMGNKVTEATFPELGLAVGEIERVHAAMNSDARPSTRAVRQPVKPTDNIIGGADELAYQKGQAVLGMVEAWLGEAAFRKGVIDYLAAHEWRNATAADLFAALSKASGQDVEAVLDGFLSRPGVPIVAVRSVSGRQVALSQKRFGTAGAAALDGRWRIPVFLRFKDASGVHAHTVLLASEKQAVTLPGTGAVEWVYPNAGETGYYRWSVPAPMLEKLAASSASLSLGERVGLVGNLRALLEGGGLGSDAYLGLLAVLARDPEPEVVAAVLSGLERVKEAFVTPELEAPFAAYVHTTLAPALERFGLEKKAGESESVSALRPQLLLRIGSEGRDAAVRAAGTRWAQAWLKDPASVDPAVAGAALRLAALEGDRALFDAYTKHLEGSGVPTQRSLLVGALGYFRDPALVDAALAYAASGPLRPTEMFAVPGGVGSSVALEERPYLFIESNYALLKTRLPEPVLAFMPQFATGCSEARLERARRFFAQPGHAVPGTDRELAKVTEAVRDCTRLRQREGARVAAYLRAAD